MWTRQLVGRGRDLALITGLLATVGSAAAQTFVPAAGEPLVSYDSIADSPFFGDGTACYALETFPGGKPSQKGWSTNNGQIVEGVGVPPGTHVLQASLLGSINLNFAPDDAGNYPSEVGFVWTGGSAKLNGIITVEATSPSQTATQSYAVPPNDPGDPKTNLFFGVSWGRGIQQIRISFNPFFGIPNQIDDIQYSISPRVDSITPTEASFDAVGGIGSAEIAMNGETCAWVASTDVDWIELDAFGGIGDGSLGYTVQTNPEAVERIGTISVGKTSQTVIQAPAECAVVQLDPAAATPGADGGLLSFAVDVNGPECVWEATTTANWIVLDVAGGTDDGIVEYVVEANPTTSERIGEIAVGGQTHTVTQQGGGAGSPVFAVDAYASLADSPYFGTGADCFEVEFFADGAATVPGLAIPEGEIVAGEGVPPGGHVVRTNEAGVLRFTIDSAAVAGGTAPTRAGLVYTGGTAATATITVHPSSGPPVDRIEILAENDPSNPGDNVFLGVEWSEGVSEIRIAVDPPSAASQFDQIQFDVDQSVCAASPARSSDFNGDRWSDLVVQNLQSGAVAVQLMLDGEGAGLAPVSEPRDDGWIIQSVGSWGGEDPGGGIAGGTTVGPSIAWRNLADGTLFGWRFQGSTFLGEYQILPTVWIGWDLVGSGDLDGDGIADFVWRNESNGVIGYWIMGGDGQPAFWDTFPQQGSISWDLVGVGDFDGNGRSDILWMNIATRQLVVWYFEANLQLDLPVGFFSSNGPSMSHVAGVADYDNDGVVDILWALGGASSTEIWYLQTNTSGGGSSTGRDFSIREVGQPVLDVGDGWRLRGGG